MLDASRIRCSTVRAKPTVRARGLSVPSRSARFISSADVVSDLVVEVLLAIGELVGHRFGDALWE